MEFRGPRYRPDRYREAERYPLTGAVMDEIAAMVGNTDALRLSITKLGGMLDLIQEAERTQKAAARAATRTADAA